MKVWLDDDRDPFTYTGQNDWLWVVTVEECLDLLRTGQVTELSLDHDLGEGRTEGHVVTDTLEEWQGLDEFYVPAKMRVHSQNFSQRPKMEGVIKRMLERRKERG